MDEAKNLVNEFKEYNERNKATCTCEPVLPLTIDFLKYILNLCETRTEEDVKKEMCFSYQRVFELIVNPYEISNPENKELLFKIITNPKFLIAVSHTISMKAPNISAVERNACSHMYLTVLQHLPNSNLEKLYSLYYNLVKITNRKMVLTLEGIRGLSEEEAVMLSAARYCSTLQSECAKNIIAVLNAIFGANKKSISVETIVAVIQILFEGDINAISYLGYMMLYGPQIGCAVPLDEKLSLGILYLLENLPTTKISEALIKYVTLYNYEVYYRRPIFPRVTFHDMVTKYREKFPRAVNMLQCMIWNKAFEHAGLMMPN